MRTLQGLIQFILLLGAVGLIGCASTEGRQRALAVAKQEVAKRGWTNIEVESVRRVDGNWRVEIWWLPKTPGGFTEIDVSDSGAVVAEYGGM